MEYTRQSLCRTSRLPYNHQNSIASEKQKSFDTKKSQLKLSRFPSIVQSVISTHRGSTNTNKPQVPMRFSIYNSTKNFNTLKQRYSRQSVLLNLRRRTKHQNIIKLSKKRNKDSISAFSGLSDEEIEETIDRSKVHQGSLLSIEGQYAHLKAIEDTIKESIKLKINSIDWNSPSKVKCKQKYYRIVWLTNILLLQKLDLNKASTRIILKISGLIESGFNLNDQLCQIRLKNTRFAWEMDNYFEKLFDFQTEFELWIQKWNRIFNIPVLHT
jgi:hypothetical protein